MAVIKKPDLSDPNLREKLAKGIGHNYYGEPAWPNDLLYIFPIVILGTLSIFGLGNVNSLLLFYCELVLISLSRQEHKFSYF